MGTPEQQEANEVDKNSTGLYVNSKVRTVVDISKPLYIYYFNATIKFNNVGKEIPDEID